MMKRACVGLAGLMQELDRRICGAFPFSGIGQDDESSIAALDAGWTQDQPVTRGRRRRTERRAVEKVNRQP